MPIQVLMCDEATSRAVCEAEEALMDIAGSLVDQGVSGEVAQHHAAVTMARELCWAHESENPADRLLHNYAYQLKCWHLGQLSFILASL